MATSTKRKFGRLASALNVIAAVCSLLAGIPWLIRQSRQGQSASDSTPDRQTRQQLQSALAKMQRSGYSSLTADERALVNKYAHKSTD